MSDRLPEGWTSAPLNEIAVINPRHPKGLDDSMPVTFVPMAALSESKPGFEFAKERPLGEVRKGFTHFSEGDVLFAKITPCMENGKGAVANGLRNGLGCGTTELHVVRPLAGIDPYYVYRFLAQPSVRREAEENFTGTAGQARVPTSFIEQLEIPLAPVAEQQRIVAKLEKLLAKVDTCQQRLATMPFLLKRFRQSVLAAACSGGLTADWRAENPSLQPASELLLQVEQHRKKAAVNPKRRTVPVQLDLIDLPEIPELWHWTTLDQIVEEGRPIIYGIIKPGPHDPNGVPYVRVVEMKDGEVVPLSQLKRASPDRASKFTRATLKAGDLLISKDGTIGRVAVVPPELEGGNITQHLVRASIHPHLCREFIAHAIRSQYSQTWLIGEKKGVALQGVNVEDFRRLPLPIPTVLEQQEIVRRVGMLFSVADRLEARYQEGKRRVDSLTRSLLGKAFRGELVPTEAELAEAEGRSFESAQELLARIKMTSKEPEASRRSGKTAPAPSRGREAAAGD